MNMLVSYIFLLIAVMTLSNPLTILNKCKLIKTAGLLTAVCRYNNLEDIPKKLDGNIEVNIKFSISLLEKLKKKKTGSSFIGARRQRKSY